MEKLNKKKVRKKSKKNYKRRISPTEIKFLITLWRWKVLSYPLAYRLSFPENTYGNFYNKIRRLIGEGYIIDVVGDGFNFQVLQLTKKGFGLIQYDLGELKELRFNPQSVAHDYWATAVQLGCFLQAPSNIVTHVTEQEIQSFETDLLPSWAPKSRDHIPDGLFQVGIGENAVRIGLEVDLNLKSFLRYDRAAYYFDGIDSKIDVVIWICGNLNIAQSIYSRLQKARLSRLDIHHFFITDDFKILGWNAKARAGQFSKKSIQEILLWKTPGNPMERAWKSYGKEDKEILFPTLKTPFKKKT